jgi:hypothetical protein
MSKEEIQKIFRDLEVATLEYYEAKNKEDLLKLEIEAKRKTWQLAKAELTTLKLI